MEEEIWKVYKKTKYNPYARERIYEVSNKGRVKCNDKIVEPYLNNHGYPHIGSFDVHRAVALLFIPNPDNKPCIDHINTIRTDNRVENLRWVTYKENCNNPLSMIHNSESKRGRVFTAEHRKKLSESHKEYHRKKRENNSSLIL